MANQLTVNDMYKALAQAKKDGYGKRYIVLSDDNEGNGFHGCFFGVIPMDDGMLELTSDTITKDKDKLVVIG